MVEEHLRKVVLMHQKDWLPIVLVAVRESTHETTGLMPISIVFSLPCDILFGACPNKEPSVTDCLVDLMYQLHDIHYCAHQHVKVASDRMKAHCDCLANSSGFQEGD
jgi:hypothetical protein